MVEYEYTKGIDLTELTLVDHIDLIRMIQEDNNGDALSALLIKHKTYILNIIRKYERNVQLQSDLLQDYYMRLAFGIKSFRGESQFTTLLFRVVYNSLCGHINKEINKPEVYSIYNSVDVGDDIDAQYVDIIEDTNGDFNTPDSLAEYESMHERVSEIIEGCPNNEYKQVLHHYFHDSLPDETVAEILDVPVGTVKSRLHYARKWIRKQLKREGILNKIS